MLRFTDELIARVARAGASGVKLLRADSGFWNTKVFKRLENAGWSYSIGVRMQKGIREAVQAAIDEDAWQAIDYRTEELTVVEAEHRDHAVVEQVIADLKDQALEHFPSGEFNANGAWTVLGALAHNLLRWTQLIGPPDTTVRAARTLRRRWLQIAGRLTRHGRTWTLHLPARWPWHGDYITALARIRALPAAA
jgi:hypothetical protein